jgi:membrane-bound serine protease (ClpP class)
MYTLAKRGKSKSIRFLVILELVFAIFTLLGVFAQYFESAAAQNASGSVLVVNFDVPVDAGSSAFMTRAVLLAQTQGASAIVIEMNTPGGLLSDMLSIVQSIQNANQSGIPTYTYVPPNALAASAGSYIAMASNKILMGPGSEIGPSTPIVVGGSTLQQNHTEDAMIKLMVGLAQKWNRNATAAYNMVYGDQAFSADQAYEFHISNGFANSLSQALGELGLGNKPVVTLSESVYEQFLSALSNTEVDGILILVGELAIVIDIYHPTVVLTIAGVLAILAGLVGLEVIGASILGFFLLALAAVLVLLELKLGHGLAVMAGVAVGAFAILLLTQGLTYSPSPINAVSEVEAAGVVGVGVLAGVYIRWVAGPLRKGKKLTGPESLIGSVGTASTALTPEGEVRVAGVIWHARSVSGNIAVGDQIRVVSREGLTLTVEKIEK